MMERALMTPSEVTKINMRGITLLLKRDKNPYKCHLTPYYKDEWGLNKKEEIIDLGIKREPKEPDYISLNEILVKISNYMDSENTERSYIKMSRTPAKERYQQGGNDFDIIAGKLLDITGDPQCIELLKDRKSVV